MRASALAMAFALVLVGGCHKPRTEALVVISTSNLTIPTDIDSVEVLVSDFTTNTPLYDLPIPFCHGSMTTTDCHSPPVTITLIPGPTSPHDQARIEVIGKQNGTKMIDDAALLTFVDGESLRLDIVLYNVCLGHLNCAMINQTCGPTAGCMTAQSVPFAGEPDLAMATDLQSPLADLSGADLLAVDDMRGSGMPDLSQRTPDLQMPPPDLAQPPDSASCQPTCGGHNCGADSCGNPNACGICPGGQGCVGGLCMMGPIPDMSMPGPDMSTVPCGTQTGAPCCAGMCMPGLHCTNNVCGP